MSESGGQSPQRSAELVAGQLATQGEERSRGIIMVAVMLGLFLAALDQTVVGTALPRIATDLGGSGLYVWVVTAYLLSSTITVPIYGKFGDVLGRKAMLITGIGIFLVGSALSGLSQNMTELIGFRTIQGLGAGALFPISLAIIGDLFSPRERGRYQGLFGAVFGLSFLVGPFIGGWLTDHASWHWIFYVNIPVGIIALVVISTTLRNHRAAAARLQDLDYLGIGVFTASVIPLLIGFSNKGLTDNQGVLNSWFSPVVGGLVGMGVVGLILFGFIERKAKHPIIPLQQFKNRTMLVSNIAVFLVAFGLFSAIVFIPRYFQVVQSMSATESGYQVWPLLVGLVGSSVAAGILITKTGRYKKMMGIAMAVLVGGGLAATVLSTSTPLWQLWVALGLMGLGVGPTMSAFTVIIQNAAKPEEMGAAVATMTFGRQIGGSVGLALAGTLFNTVFLGNIPGALRAAGVPAGVVALEKNNQGVASNSYGAVGNLSQTIKGQLQGNIAQVHAGIASGKIPPASGNNALAVLHEALQHVGGMVTGIYAAFTGAVGAVFWIVVGAGGLAFLAVLLLKEIPLRSHRGEHPDGAEDGSENQEMGLAGLAS